MNAKFEESFALVRMGKVKKEDVKKSKVKTRGTVRKGDWCAKLAEKDAYAKIAWYKEMQRFVKGGKMGPHMIARYSRSGIDPTDPRSVEWLREYILGVEEQQRKCGHETYLKIDE